MMTKLGKLLNGKKSPFSNLFGLIHRLQLYVDVQHFITIMESLGVTREQVLYRTLMTIITFQH